MKTLISMILPLAALSALVSCIQMKGNGSQWSMNALGSDISDLDITASGAKSSKIDNSSAFKIVVTEGRKAWSHYLIAEGIKYIAGKYFDLQGTELSEATTVKLEELKNANSVDLAKIKLEELKALEAAAL